MEKNKNLIKKDFDNYLKKEKENYLSLIKLVNRFATQNPNINIVFRPHPRQRLDLVKKRFIKKNKNIKVIYKGVITPWIAACELYLHGGCTSFLEAASLQKKMIYFIAADHKKKAKMFKKYGYYFNELNKCLNFMNSKITKKKFNLRKANIPKLIIANSERKKTFYKEFIKFLKNKYSNKLKKIEKFYKEKNILKKSFSTKKTEIKKILLKSPILSEAFFKLDGSNILSQEYKIKKFPNLLKSEINDCLLAKLKSKKKISVKELSKNLFHLKRSN